MTVTKIVIILISCRVMYAADSRLRRKLRNRKVLIFLIDCAIGLVSMSLLYWFADLLGLQT